MNQVKPIKVSITGNLSDFFIYAGIVFRQSGECLVRCNHCRATSQKDAKENASYSGNAREKSIASWHAHKKLADEDKSAEGLQILTRLQKRSDQLNSYERAMMWNFTGFIHYGNNNTNGALAAFKQVVAIKKYSGIFRVIDFI